VVAFAYEPPAMGAEMAEQRQARLIVIGTHGERPLMGVVLGSTSYKLLHRSPVPLLVVRAPASGD
jgi:nucleotide-binding universal stress UspA family protein